MKLAAALLPLALLSSTAAVAEPAMWKASDEDSTVWLFGSIHVLDADPSWRTGALEQALEQADLVYYETPTDPQAQAALAPLVMKHGMNPSGTTLSSYLDEAGQARLGTIAEQLEMPVAGLEPMKPWLAAMTLTVLAAQRAGHDMAGGVEQVLAPLTDDERERFFETGEEQMGFFAGLSDEVQTGLLLATLDQLAEEPELFDEMTRAWRAGDEKKLAELTNASLLEVDPALHRTLIVERNEAWASELAELMAGDQDVLVVVGAAHLIGEDGVPALLKKRGVQVERVQ